jgi:deazaflavin-dependent oxidoreductase (nitroreductase family)
MAGDLETWLTTNPVSTFLFKHLFSKIDPILFRATNGKYFSMGPPPFPMVTITMTGRKTGKKRSVHLAAIPHEGDHLVVAGAMGQQKHPGWRYNREANPEVEIQLPGERCNARAELLSDGEKEKVWGAICEATPQILTYEKRTDRNIRVFRLVRS